MTELKKILSRLSFTKACKILGAQGKELLNAGGRFDIDIEESVQFTADTLTVTTASFSVVISYDLACKDRLRIESSTGIIPCVEVAAVLALVLEEKMALGLAKPPVERVPIESLSPADLRQTALSDRADRANNERMNIVSADPDTLWTDYMVTNKISGKSYRVALRSLGQGDSYCSCPDFKTNRLGTCKHIMKVETFATRKFKVSERKIPYVRTRSSVTVRYTASTPKLQLLPGQDLSPGAMRLAGPYISQPVTENITEFAQTLEQLRELVPTLHIHPDAEDLINQRLFLERIDHEMQVVRNNTETHPLRTELLNATLRPYQLGGIAFAVQKGRAILADDMGLGKTIQGAGMAELLAREARIKRTLVICPASLKTQWREEILRFTNRSVQLVLGGAPERVAQYENDTFFTICNYEQVLRDITSIEVVPWDLIILDEAQRIKNWESQTSKIIKSLKSPFALVLTGTPLENRLEELFTVVSFIDNHRLGPAYDFLNRHREVDDRGKVLGYKELGKVRKLLEPIMLRRTRAMVLKELPPRTNHVVRITPHDEQATIDAAQRRIVNTIISKAYISEMDLLRLQKALLTARMAADSTFLVTKKEPAYSSKLERMRELIADLLVDPERKIVVFSEWTTMLDLIQQQVIPDSIDYVRLDGSVPQKMRGALVKRFRTSADCRIFLTSNAGATGLNLQAANTVVNVDLPWNPAILEQRIGRAHRMGQNRPVDVYILVSEGTIEESMLATLGAKKELADAAIDFDSEIEMVSLQSGIEELKRRLEVLIAPPPDKELDKSMQLQVKSEVDARAQMAVAGGRLLTAAFDFLGAAFSQPSTHVPSPAAAAIFNQFAAGAEKTPAGDFNLNITLNPASLQNLANTLATIMQGAMSGERESTLQE